MQFYFFLNPYFSNISIIMCLEIRGYSVILGCSSVRCYTPTKMSPNLFIRHNGGGGVHKLLIPPISTFFTFKISSSLLLIELKGCWSFKGHKLFDLLPGLLPHPVINEYFQCMSHTPGHQNWYDANFKYLSLSSFNSSSELWRNVKINETWNE